MQKRAKILLLVCVIFITYGVIGFISPYIRNMSPDFFYYSGLFFLALGGLLPVVYGIGRGIYRKYSSKSTQSTEARELKDKERLDNLRNMVQVSKRLKVSQMAAALGMSEKALWQRLFTWAKEFGFTVDQDTVEFGGGRKDEFINALEKEFATWGNKGKV